MPPVHCDHNRESELEDELAIAEKARSEGDWKHALRHDVDALSVDAFSEQALAAIRRMARENAVLAELEGNSYFGAQLARAYLLADAGQYPEAAVIVARVDEVMPHLEAVRLLLDWFDRVAGDQGARDQMARRLGGIADVGMGRVHLLEGERAAVAPYADLAERLVVDATNPVTLAVASGILRRAGRTAKAVELAERVAATNPTSNVLVAWALGHRANGEPARAVELFERIYRETGDSVFSVEKARALADNKEFEAARQHLQRFENESGQALNGEDQLFMQWIEACLAGNQGALAVTYDRIRRRALFHGWIPSMEDASVNVLGSVKKGEKISVGVSSLEAPSVRLCMALHIFDSTDPRDVSYSTNEVPSPDPRVPRGRVSRVLWHEVDGVMVQAVAPPDAPIRDLVTKLAQVNTDLLPWWDIAVGMAPETRSHAEELANAMVYPPPPPEGMSTAVWVFRYQLAAAFLIATSESGWRGTERRKVLLDLLRGPIDWTTSAAVMAVGEAALHDAEALPEIRRELIALTNGIPEPGHCCFGTSLAITAQKIPLFPPHIVKNLSAQFFSSDDDESEEEGDAEEEDGAGEEEPS